MADELDRELLERLMAAMAAGDKAAILTFIDNFGGHIAVALRHHLSQMGHRNVAADDDEIDGLVIDAAFLLYDRSNAWSPTGGALPWTWAGRALRGLAASHIGHASVPFEPERHGGSTQEAAAKPPSWIDFDALADGDPVVGMLRTAISSVASERDAVVHIEYQLQKACGDPSPSQTVASMTGLSNANVRQIDRRVRARLDRLIRREERFAALRQLGWLDRGGGKRPTESATTELGVVA